MMVQENGHQKTTMCGRISVKAVGARKTHQEHQDGEHHEEDGIPVLQNPSLQVGQRLIAQQQSSQCCQRARWIHLLRQNMMMDGKAQFIFSIDDRW